MVQPHGEAFSNKKKELKNQAGLVSWSKVYFIINGYKSCKFYEQTLILWRIEKANTFTYNNKQHFLWKINNVHISRTIVDRFLGLKETTKMG